MGEIDFKNVDIEGLESSPFTEELAGLRAWSPVLLESF